MSHPNRKPSIPSRRREPVISEDVLRAVLCEAKTEAEIEAMTCGSSEVVARLLGYLMQRGLVKKTDAGYVPAEILRRAG